MRTFSHLAQQLEDHLGVLNYIIHCLDFDIIAMIGTSDQSCWLAQACKILVLLWLMPWLNAMAKPYLHGDH